MLLAIAGHLVIGLGLPFLARRWGRAALIVGALVPAAALVSVLLISSGADPANPAQETLAWAPLIGLEITLRSDALAVLMTILVCGVGALVLTYYASYVQPDDPNIGRNAALLVIFAGGMLGLVLADDIFSLYLFWEITTVCSFLLVGGDGVTMRARRSATQALLVTAMGGLAMLLGLILLAAAADTFLLSEIVADPPPAGMLVNTAIALVLVGAFTKSAQIPFHFWLPAAMVAPTPVSAYLHAAAMVKAGVYLVARLAPGFSALSAWWIPVLLLGVSTMILGGVRALRQNDLKTLLAFGTVSQLGFLTVLLGSGSHVAALAGITLVLAHGLFKSTLFLTVGVIDKRTGTRDIRELSGLGRRWPILTGAAILAAGSMAGIGPLLGFVGKEAAFEAFTGGTARQQVVLVGLLIGSMLTVAYSLRFLIGAFGSRSGKTTEDVVAPGGGLLVPVLLPSVAGLVLGVLPQWVEPLANGYARVYPTGAAPYHLALWHGWTVPLLLSVLVVAVGVVLYRSSRIIGMFTGQWPPALRAEPGYRTLIAGLDRISRAVTGRLQVGSLPVYIGVIIATMVVVPAAGLLAGVSQPWSFRLTDVWLQLPLAVMVLAAAGGVVLARRRLTAILLTGVIGYGIGALFIVEGGVDLALAQFLVESLTLVVFVFVLRRFSPAFRYGPPRPRRIRWGQFGLASAGGIFIAVLALVMSSARTELPRASQEYIERAESEAGATNVVNAIIVDFRAFDTLGEITVLVVAAVGAASLILAAHRERRRPAATSDSTGNIRSTDTLDGEEVLL